MEREVHGPSAGPDAGPHESGPPLSPVQPEDLERELQEKGRAALRARLFAPINKVSVYILKTFLMC